MNLAPHMESTLELIRITISERTNNTFKEDFVCSERGENDVKGFGPMKLYYLECKFFWELSGFGTNFSFQVTGI